MYDNSVASHGETRSLSSACVWLAGSPTDVAMAGLFPGPGHWILQKAGSQQSRMTVQS